MWEDNLQSGHLIDGVHFAVLVIVVFVIVRSVVKAESVATHTSPIGAVTREG